MTDEAPQTWSLSYIALIYLNATEEARGKNLQNRLAHAAGN